MSVGLGAAGLFAVEPCTPVGAKLVELRVKRLPVGVDTGVSEAAGFRSYLLQSVTL